MKTPHLDALRARLRTALEPHGSQIDLARHLAEQLGGTPKHYMVRLHAFLTGTSGLHGEPALAITAWLDGRRKTRKTTTSPKSGRRLVRDN